jgi:hypothetical protein
MEVVVGGALWLYLKAEVGGDGLVLCLSFRRFQISFGDDQVACHSEVPLGGFSLSRLKLCSTAPSAPVGEVVKRPYADGVVGLG